MFKISRKLKISQSGHYDGDVTSTTNAVTFGRLAVSDSELGVDVIDFDECYCYLFVYTSQDEQFSE